MNGELDLERYKAAFTALAQAANRLPEQDKEEISTQLGEFTHDLKHILGLVTGANALLLRSATANEEGGKIIEMVEIINDSAERLNAYFMILVENLYHSLEQDSP